VTRIVEFGITRVVAATEDPSPRVAGRGFAWLRDHGVDVEVGRRRLEARHQNAGFFSVMMRRRPFVIAKIATSLDGRIGRAGGQRVVLTANVAARYVQTLRASVDAIVVGSGTLLADDPLLTARDVWRDRPLVRMICDRRLRTPATARIFGTLEHGPVVVGTSASSAARHPERVAALEAAGARVAMCSPPTLGAMLEHLVTLDVTLVLLEGGAALHQSAWKEGLIDRVHVLVTPHVLGADAVPWLDAACCSLAALGPAEVRVIGPDVLLEADVHRAD
jgi:diaminohydroxyphosphoribosylaminopyrimidine deaminase / 5-amino-6-(5-phosphoribosylamino)uracil reductase